MLTSVDGELWSKKSIGPSDRREDGFNAALNASWNLASSFHDLVVACSNLASLSISDFEMKDELIFTSSDFNLHKEWNSTLNKSGIKVIT